MIKKTITTLLSLILLTTASLYSQENNNIPFPSLLMVKYQKGYVLINFDPLKDPSYSYKIYRSNSAILKDSDLTDKNLVKIIKSSDLPFKDVPDKDGKYYYAVIATKNGKDFKKIIPLQNTTIYPVDFSPYPRTVKIKKIVKKKDNEIEINIDPVHKNWKYFLYISNKKIENLGSLKSKQIIIGPRNIFNIKIHTGMDYYFAVIVQNRLGIKNDELSPGNNVTIKPFKLKEIKQISKSTEKKKKNLVGKPKLLHRSKPKTKTIINRTISIYFVKGNYKRTIQELNWILKTYPTDSKQKSNIYFYLGQSYFYIKNYAKAVKYFILCKDYPYYREEAEAWIDRVLGKIN